MVQVTKGGLGQLQCAEADVVEGLIVEHDTLVSVLDQLMEGKGRVVRLNDDIGDLG